MIVGPFGQRGDRRRGTTLAIEDRLIIRKLVVSAITSDAGLTLLAPVRPRCATILMLHRFAIPDQGIPGHDPGALSRSLEYLRRRRYALIGISDLVDRLERGIPLERNTVVFTVDDGYADFATAASPVFSAYDCPVTVFLVTDFVAGRIWNWYDRVEWCVEETSREGVDLDLPNDRLTARWTNRAERAAASSNIVERLKQVPDVVKEEGVRALASALELEIPAKAPERYRPLSWDQIHACGRHGATFGAHTLTHPILSHVDDTRAAIEISESWKAVSDATEWAVPVFCYPNGTAADFSVREERLVAKAGMRAAVSAIEGSIAATHSGFSAQNPFSLPRFPYSQDKQRFVQIASGLEQMKSQIKHRFARGRKRSPH